MTFTVTTRDTATGEPGPTFMIICQSRDEARVIRLAERRLDHMGAPKTVFPWTVKRGA